MRVVDAEDFDACLDPVIKDGLQLQPEVFPVVALEVDRHNVLVFLGWVLCVLAGAIGAPFKPLRVLFDPRVLGRALKGDVHRDFDFVVRGCSR